MAAVERATPLLTVKQCSRRSKGSGFTHPWGLGSAVGGVTWGKGLNLSVPQFPHVQNNEASKILSGYIIPWY